MTTDFLSCFFLANLHVYVELKVMLLISLSVNCVLYLLSLEFRVL